MLGPSHTHRARNWCGTVFDLAWRPPPLEENDIRYIVYQNEVAPDTGTEHIQFYVEFRKSVRRTAAFRLLGIRCHLESRKGTREQARQYCMKQDTRKEGTEPVELGEWVAGDGSGRRGGSMAAVLDLVRQGHHPRSEAVVEAGPAAVLRYQRSLMSFYDDYIRRASTEEREVKITTYYGPPRTGAQHTPPPPPASAGKSRRAWWEAKALGLGTPFSKHPGTVWWCGYDASKVVLFEDLSHEDRRPQRELLRLFDRYPVSIQYKGGTTWAAWTHIFITSNEHPCWWYDGGDMAQYRQSPLFRRLEQEHGSQVVHMVRLAAAKRNLGPVTTMWTGPGSMGNSNH